jgi:hypothetical protein
MLVKLGKLKNPVTSMRIEIVGEDEWLSLHLGRFVVKKITFDTIWVGVYLGLGSDLDNLEKKKILPSPKSIPAFQA